MAQIYNDVYEKYEKLEHFPYRRSCDFWKIGDEFLIPSDSELKDRLFFRRINRGDYEFELPYISVLCKDGIERELSLNLLRKSIAEFDNNLEMTGKVYESHTKLYQHLSQARNAKELFHMLVNLSGKSVRVVDVLVVKTKGECGLRQVTLPCFEAV